MQEDCYFNKNICCNNSLFIDFIDNKVYFKSVGQVDNLYERLSV